MGTEWGGGGWDVCVGSARVWGRDVWGQHVCVWAWGVCVGSGHVNGVRICAGSGHMWGQDVCGVVMFEVSMCV